MQTQVNVRSECSELTNTAHAGLRSARRRIGTLAAVLALSVLPQQALSQVRPSKSRATPAATRLVPSQGVVAVAPARSRKPGFVKTWKLTAKNVYSRFGINRCSLPGPRAPILG